MKELEPAMPPDADVRFDFVTGPEGAAEAAAVAAAAACAAPNPDGTGIPLGRSAARLVILQSRLYRSGFQVSTLARG